MKIRVWFLAGIVSCGAFPAWGQFGGFGGPSILSRGTGRIGTSGGRPIRFRGFAGLNAGYGTNLTNVASDGQGNLNSDSSATAGVNAGFGGYYQGERSSSSGLFGVNYQFYNKAQYYSGLNMRLEASHARQTSRRTAVYLSAAGYTTNRVTFGAQQFTEEPVAQVQDPSFQIFDARTYAYSLAAGVGYRPTARWTISGQVGYYGTAYQSAALVTYSGGTGGASATYALSARHGVGIAYSYGRWFYRGGFGQSDNHVVMGLYYRTLSPRWRFNMGAGAYRVFAERLVPVAVDPWIAELTGQDTVLEIFRGATVNFSGYAGLTGRFQRSSVSFNYMRGVLPGNGVYLTTDRETLMASYTYYAGRRWTVGAFGSASRYKALTQSIGTTKGYGAGGNFNYRIAEYLTFNATLSLFRTQSYSDPLTRNRVWASVGLFFSPGDIPVSIF